MERIKDALIIRLIEQISEHYRSNISNRFLRPILLQIQIDKSTWDQIEELTEKMEINRYQGFHMDELYLQIAACARFIEAARSQMIPSLKTKLGGLPNSQDKILREMAANNFDSNLKVFSDLLNQLFLNLTEMDKAVSGSKPPVYSTLQELYSINRLLAGH